MFIIRKICQHTLVFDELCAQHNAMPESLNDFLERVVDAIQVPQSKYEDAVTSYQSICRWFERQESTIRLAHIESYLQGSFRLGTAIRPTTEEDDYDLDIVVVLGNKKSEIAPAELKRRVGVEVKSYAASHGMTRPTDGRRCWTQDYADQRQFHVDTLPCIPDATGLQQKLEARQLAQDFVSDAIAITDKTCAKYNAIHPDWPNSNPKGYALWFESRMGAVLTSRKQAIALLEGRSVEDIPTYRAVTPLQKAIQILKYHRDVMFADDMEDRPISIIITTLSAHAYRGEQSIEGALGRILQDMDKYIEARLGVDWVQNPTNAMENFADKWVEYPKRKENFQKWLEAARSDFSRLRGDDDVRRQAILTEAFGDEAAVRVSQKNSEPRSWKKRNAIFATHREAPPWSLQNAGSVKIKKATWARRGSIRTTPFSSDSKPVPKQVDVRFYATTDVPSPFEVYWQIVNTGEEAERANCLRGAFEVGAIHSGNLTRKEPTAYAGSHTVECFIVKDGFLAARSGQFIVNIA